MCSRHQTARHYTQQVRGQPGQGGAVWARAVRAPVCLCVYMCCCVIVCLCAAHTAACAPNPTPHAHILLHAPQTLPPTHTPCCVGSDKKIKEFEEAPGSGTQITKEVDTGATLTQIALLPNAKVGRRPPQYLQPSLLTTLLALDSLARLSPSCLPPCTPPACLPPAFLPPCLMPACSHLCLPACPPPCQPARPPASHPPAFLPPLPPAPCPARCCLPPRRRAPCAPTSTP